MDTRTPQRKRRTFEHVLEVRWPSTGGHRRLIIGTPPNLIGVSNACFIRVMRSREEVDCEALRSGREADRERLVLVASEDSF